MERVLDDIFEFFERIDPPLGKHYKDTMWNMKLRIDDLLTRIFQVTMLHMKLEKHKYLRQAEREVTDAYMLIEVETMKKKVTKLVMICMVCVLVVVLYSKLF
uniref:Uncharacterized protein n=1 Tax=Lactuca sativa TaxID=4236 RepID=A0A9R1V158_LACSA|nr:hypothetical protein LSAT_V11C700346270 [Lactuca sativa]